MKIRIWGLLILSVWACQFQEKQEGENFTMDFSHPKKLIYTFSQTADNVFKVEAMEHVDSSFAILEGVLNVRVKENALADLSITEAVIKTVSFDATGIPEDTSRHEQAPIAVTDMDAYGTFPQKGGELPFNILFGLPKGRLTPGDTEKLPLQIPFNANGSSLLVKGSNTLTFSGYDTLDHRRCAVFRGVIDIADLEIPEEISVDYKCVNTGTASYYFAVKEQYFVQVDLRLGVEMWARKEIEQETAPSFFQKMEMNTNSVYKIRLKEILE